MFVYKEMMSEFPPDLFSRISAQTGVDYKVSKLTGENIFNVLLYSLLEKNETSLRTIEENYRLICKDTTRHSSIASRLETMSPVFFQEIFSWCVDHFALSNDQQEELRIIDSTTLQLSNKLLKSGVPCRATSKGQKNSIKCVVATNGEFAQLMTLHTISEGWSDEATFRSMVLESGQGAICIFDRGLKKRHTFHEFIAASFRFITRGNNNIRYKTVLIHSQVEGKRSGDLLLQEDLIVRLAQNGSRFLPYTIRLIRAVHYQTGKAFTFLTSIDDLSAEDICALYKKRWSIEIFFKFIKQELNATHLLGRTPNAISITLYMVLIAALLILEYKKRTKIKSYKFARRAFMHELKLEILKPIILFCGGDPEKVYLYEFP